MHRGSKPVRIHRRERPSPGLSTGSAQPPDHCPSFDPGISRWHPVAATPTPCPTGDSASPRPRAEAEPTTKERRHSVVARWASPPRIQRVAPARRVESRTAASVESPDAARRKKAPAISIAASRAPPSRFVIEPSMRLRRDAETSNARGFEHPQKLRNKNITQPRPGTPAEVERSGRGE
jgi:hypothetical protein